MVMGAGLRPEAKAEDEPPDPTVRAPVLDPTGGRGGPNQWAFPTEWHSDYRNLLRCKALWIIPGSSNNEL